jgi:hypothetical protein
MAQSLIRGFAGEPRILLARGTSEGTIVLRRQIHSTDDHPVQERPRGRLAFPFWRGCSMALDRLYRLLLFSFRELSHPGYSCQVNRPQLECLEDRDLFSLFTPLPPFPLTLSGSLLSPALGRGSKDSGALLAVDQAGNSGGGPAIDVVHLFRSDATGQFNSVGMLTFPTADDSTFLAVGDFNGDGYADLAVGRFARVGGFPGTGTTNTLLVYLGGPSGLQTTPDETFSLDSLVSLVGGVRPAVELSAMTAGDLNGDNNTDLAVTFEQPFLAAALPTS